MQEKFIKMNSIITTDGYYKSWFRCTNCGTIFQHELRIGSLCSTMAGICPTCGVKSGVPGTGVFPVIKFNPKYDEIQRHYFK